MSLGRIATSRNLPYKLTASLIQRRLVRILTLHPFSTAHLTSIKILVKGLAVRIATLRQVTTLASIIINK